MLEYDSVYDVHSPPITTDPTVPLSTQSGYWFEDLILSALDRALDYQKYETYDYVLIYSVPEVPGWINSGYYRYVAAKNIGRPNADYHPRYDFSFRLRAVPHMNAIAYMASPSSWADPGQYGMQVAVHEMAHFWGVYWGNGRWYRPQDWKPDEPIGWLATYHQHWSYNWAGAAGPGIMDGFATRELQTQFNAFDLYALGLMDYAEARNQHYSIYEDPTGQHIAGTSHVLGIDDLIYLNLLQGSWLYEAPGQRAPATEPEARHIRLLPVIIKGKDDVMTSAQEQLIRNFVDRMPQWWNNATWGRSTAEVGILEPTGPATMVSATTLTFAPQMVGGSNKQTMSLTNRGTADLNIAQLTFNVPDYSATHDCGTALPPQRTCTISVTFTPIAAGYRGGILYVSSNSVAGPWAFGMDGIGIDIALAAANGVPISTTITAGETAKFAVLASPTNEFAGPISFSCSGAPVLSTCSVTPTEVVITEKPPQPVQVEVSVSTTRAIGASASPLVAGSATGWLAFPMALLAALVGVGAARYRRKLACLFALVALVLFFGSCGGGSQVQHQPGTPAGTYTIVVSATSGSVSRSTNLTMTVR